jgi:hypothetical protein
MSRSLSAKSLKVRRSGSEEDSKALKMRVPQQSREFFAGGISSAGVETGFCLTVFGDYLAHDDFPNGLI